MFGCISWFFVFSCTVLSCDSLLAYLAVHAIVNDENKDIIRPPQGIVLARLGLYLRRSIFFRQMPSELTERN